jgi:hypothetical protein
MYVILAGLWADSTSFLVPPPPPEHELFSIHQDFALLRSVPFTTAGKPCQEDFEDFLGNVPNLSFPCHSPVQSGPSRKGDPRIIIRW